MKQSIVKTEVEFGTYGPDAFTRLDSTDDLNFYRTDRFVSHLDEVALQTVERIIGKLIVEEQPIVLDLMAGPDSHLPTTLKAQKVIGLGLNENELAANKALDEFVIHDLNKNPILPFGDASFDVVINTVSVDYLTRPFELFTEVGRILKPSGLHLVIFSNRMFPQKAVKIWREASEQERVMLVEDYFNASGQFKPVSFYLSAGKERPADDKYAGLGVPSDPIYVMYSERIGGPPTHRPDLETEFDDLPDLCYEDANERKKHISRTLQCPYCGDKLKKVAVPQTPFTEWSNEFMHVCFNDSCPYLVRGWKAMARQGNHGFSYRMMYNPDNDTCSPLLVTTLNALKDQIVEE